MTHREALEKLVAAAEQQRDADLRIVAAMPDVQFWEAAVLQEFPSRLRGAIDRKKTLDALTAASLTPVVA